MRLPVNYEKTHFTVRKLVREEYVRLQGGSCWYCKASLDGKPNETVSVHSVNPRLFPASFFRWPVHLHHSHKTGMTVGAVHNHCNAVLWQYFGQ